MLLPNQEGFEILVYDDIKCHEKKYLDAQLTEIYPRHPTGAQ